jgi:hypothetical protein
VPTVKNYWLEEYWKKEFARRIKDLIYKKYGIEKINQLSQTQYSHIAKQIKKIYVDCQNPKINKLSEIDNIVT